VKKTNKKDYDTRYFGTLMLNDRTPQEK